MKKIFGAILFLPILGISQNTFVKQVPTGTGAPVQQTSPTLITPALGTPSAIVLTNATGSPTGITVAQSQVTGLVTDLGNKLGITGNGSGLIGITATQIGATTVGNNIFSLANPSAIRFLRVNADNTVTARTAAELLTDIGAQASGSYQPLNSNLTTYAGITPSANVQTLLSAADYAAFKTSLGLQNVTNESKATMFTNATFTGTFATAAGAIGNAALANGAVANLSGTNTGDQTTVTGNAGTATIWQTARNLWGNSINGSADITSIIASTYGGTGNGFTKFSGPATSEKTFTLPNASATILTDNSSVTVGQGGTGNNTFTGIMVGNGTSAMTAVAGTASQFLRRNAGNTAYEFATLVGGGDALTSNPLSQFAATTSTQLRGVLSDENGTGVALFDAATNPSFNNIKGTYTTTATAAGTTTLTVTSTYDQLFTGATTQDCILPDATTLTAGIGYHVINNSTGVVTVKKNGGATVKALAAGTELYVTVTDISTSAGTYISSYSTDLAIGSATGTDLTLSATTPTTPAADNTKLFTYKVGGRSMLGWIDPSGLDNAVQSLFGRNGMKIFQPAGNSTTITAIGSAALTATGTATAANIATTNRHTQIRGLEYLVTVAATTAVAGFRDGVAQFFMGNSAGNGGFHFVCRFGPATGVATTTHRLFVGMGASTAAPTDVEPSSIVNIIGVGYDAADANIQFFNNDATGTATKTSLGIAVPTADRTSVYELSMFCAPNSTTITYTFKDLAEGGSTVSGTVSTDIPAVNTMLASRGWMSVGGTSSVIGISLKSLYIESDY